MVRAGEYDACMRTRFLIFTLVCAALASCAGKKPFTIRTVPVDGAVVHINGKLIEGTTPVTTEIEQDKDLGIVVEKPGYNVGSATVRTRTSWWLSLLWTEDDPKARYIEEDEVVIPMQRMNTINSYTPTLMPSFTPPAAAVNAAPALRPLPAGY